MDSTRMNVGIIGAGTMGIGIAQVASAAGCHVKVYDKNTILLEQSIHALSITLTKLVQKGKISEQELSQIKNNIVPINELHGFGDADVVIEAIIENIDIKKSLFQSLEPIVDEKCVIASNTSSLSIASLSSVFKKPQRFLGLHFFNPAPLMKLVEIIPSIRTDAISSEKMFEVMLAWKKKPVIAKDTPGFIVNRVVRSFYGEALRIFEEGIASIEEIDWAMKHFGGFKMGPFELMDLIGNDVNYAVTKSVFESMYFEARFKPSVVQLRMVEAGLYGKKTGIGFYDYSKPKSVVTENKNLEKIVFERVIATLINEAHFAYQFKVASKEDIDVSVIFGAGYPKGLFQWADELGIHNVLSILNHLHTTYQEERYRPCILLKN